MGRTGQQRLQAIEPALVEKEVFLGWLDKAGNDVLRCADLMAFAIAMEQEARGLEVVGRDGRVLVTVERVISAHCALAAKEAYHRARGTK